MQLKRKHIILGEQVQNLRRRIKLSQTEFGDKLGYSQRIVSNWELGVTAIPAVLLPELVKALKTSYAELFSPLNQYISESERPKQEEERPVGYQKIFSSDK